MPAPTNPTPVTIWAAILAGLPCPSKPTTDTAVKSAAAGATIPCARSQGPRRLQRDASEHQPLHEGTIHYCHQWRRSIGSKLSVHSVVFANSRGQRRPGGFVSTAAHISRIGLRGGVASPVVHICRNGLRICRSDDARPTSICLGASCVGPAAVVLDADGACAPSTTPPSSNHTGMIVTPARRRTETRCFEIVMARVRRKSSADFERVSQRCGPWSLTSTA